jgi:hypothetical protein
MLSYADFRRMIDGAKRQSMTSVGEVTAEEGIEPANFRLFDDYGTTRPLPAHFVNWVAVGTSNNGDIFNCGESLFV